MLRMLSVIIIGLAGLGPVAAFASAPGDCTARLLAYRVGELQRFSLFLERVESEGSANFDYGPEVPTDSANTIIEYWPSDESLDDSPDRR